MTTIMTEFRRQLAEPPTPIWLVYVRHEVSAVEVTADRAEWSADGSVLELSTGVSDQRRPVATFAAAQVVGAARKESVR